MVERPIKKSERTAEPSTSDSSEPRAEQEDGRERRERGNRDKKQSRRGDRKGKGEREKVPAVPPALMRGPKPVKASAPEPEPEVSEETSSEEASEEAIAEDTPVTEELA